MEKMISVLIPVYNVQEYLPKCIQSLKNQTYKNLEIIFVDDCSTDNSLKILQEQTQDMQNVKIIKHEQNKGLFLARITALNECTGDYIAFLDSDDYVDDNFYENYLNKIIEKDAEMCICDFSEIGEDQVARFYMRWFRQKIELNGEQCLTFFADPRTLPTGLTMLWRKLIKREVYERVKEDLNEIASTCGHIVGGEDSLYSIVICSKVNKIIFEYGPKYYYCKHPNQSVDFSSKEKFLKQAEHHIKVATILRKYAIKNNFYEKYHNYDCNYLTIITRTYRHKADSLDCVEEYNNLLDKYNINDIVKVVFKGNR